MRRTSALVIAILLLITLPGAAHAQTACDGAVIRQDDMAGVYVSSESLMRVEVYPCGGTYLQWDNDYGRHAAAYRSIGRLPQGGIVSEGMIPDSRVGGFLDLATRIGIKPAEPGWIQVITIGDYLESIQVYRLLKIR